MKRSSASRSIGNEFVRDLRQVIDPTGTSRSRRPCRQTTTRDGNTLRHAGAHTSQWSRPTETLRLCKFTLANIYSGCLKPSVAFACPALFACDHGRHKPSVTVVKSSPPPENPTRLYVHFPPLAEPAGAVGPREPQNCSTQRSADHISQPTAQEDDDH